MNRYPNHKLPILVLALAVSLLAVAFVRLPKAAAAPAPNPTCTMNPVVTNGFDNGAESLRQAAADACPGSTITFDLTGTIQLFGGNITIDKNLSIQGPGASVLTVQNTAAQAATSRIFYVNAGVTATITGITITGGNVTGDGAGIYNNGTLTVKNSIITNNTMVGDGGGIYNNGTLTVIGSTISTNGKTVSNETGVSRVGGGIYNHGTLTVTGSIIHDNLSFPPFSFHFFCGGGIYNAGIANISNSTFSSNHAGGEGGGAISNVPGGTLNVTDSIFDSNFGHGAGSIFNFASAMNITNSTFTNNWGLKGGAIYSMNGAATVTNSTISNNRIDNSLDNGGGGGGGIYLEFGTMTLANSTVSNNRAEGPINSFNNDGGGIYVNNATLNMTNSTVANNTAADSEGGGIYRSGGPLGTVNSRNSIIAGNTARAGRDFVGTLNSQGYNLIGNTANTTITGVTTGNILNQDPLLLPLADNGGPTKTLALQSTSPAIDAGDSSLSTTDQRGAVRPSDQAPANASDGADIGAFEFSPNTTITAHPADPSNSGSPSFSFTVTNGVAFAGFQCRLDSSGFTACASPQTYNSVPDGSHTFSVRAVDSAGNAVGLQPSFTWTIDTTQPETTIDNTPANPSAPNVGFRFSGSDSGTGIAGFECDLEGGGFTACTSPKTFNGLIPGSHTFQVRAIDAVGNVDQTPASFTWNVDRICTINPVVTSLVTGDDGSLRLAVANACAGSTITFNVTGSIPLRSGQITLDKDLTIQGPGANLLTVRNTAAQSDTSRVFLVNGGVTATISGLTITGGNIAGGIIPGGGGIYSSGTLTVTNSIISNNSASLGGGIYNFRGTVNVTNSTIENSNATSGGGIYNSLGTVHVTNSTINNNNVNSAGGGIYNDGILTLGVLTVTNSTISNNTVGDFGAVGGGGIYNNSDGGVNLTNSTITNNSELAGGSTFGGGINNLSGSTVNCRNTIIAGNTGTFGDFAGTLTSQGYNLIGVTSGTTIVGDTTGNILNQNAMLGPLQNNGGATETHALLTGSPAVDQGNRFGSSTDQRGIARPFDLLPLANAPGGDGADIGAFEVQFPTASGSEITGTITQADGTPLGGVVLQLAGTTASFTITDSAGHYSFTELEAAGFYTVTPQLANYGFSPGARSFSLVGNRTEADFAATPDDVESANPLDMPEYFVRQQYLDFLGREPDQSGLNFWTQQISACGPDATCVEARRVNTSAAFFLSIEFQQTGYLVYRTYKAAYGDIPGAPVPIKLSDFLADTNDIGQGVVVNQNGWEQVLENNTTAFMVEFVQRPRFRSVYPTALIPAEFVDRLFVNAGVSPTTSERASAVTEFGSATTSSDIDARARVLRQVAENATLAQKELNRAFVLMQYFGYLRRNPVDAPESSLDYSGYYFWLEKLASFDGNFVNSEMVKAFLRAAEYRQRFARE